MSQPHFYDNLDKDSKLSLEIDMRALAEHLVSMNYGVHRLLSHLIDVRRERQRRNILEYRECGKHPIADCLEREGDRLADGIEELLLRGLV